MARRLTPVSSLLTVLSTLPFVSSAVDGGGNCDDELEIDAVADVLTEGCVESVAFST